MRAYEHVVRRATNSFCFQIYLEDQGEKIAIILSALKCNWRFDYSYCYSRSPACSLSLSLVLFRSHMNDIPKLSSNRDDKEIVFIYKISFYCSPYISRERAKKNNVPMYWCACAWSLYLFVSFTLCLRVHTKWHDSKSCHGKCSIIELRLIDSWLSGAVGGGGGDIVVIAGVLVILRFSGCLHVDAFFCCRCTKALKCYQWQC